MSASNSTSKTQIPHSTIYASLPTKSYQAQLQEKVQRLTALLTPFTTNGLLDGMAIFESDTSHFRMRAEFGIWHEDNAEGVKDCFYTMTETDAQGNKKKVRVDSFAIANTAINALMPTLMAKIKANELLKQKLFQVEFLSTLAGDMLVTLIYHKKLDEEWEQLAKQLEADLNCHIIGRSRKQKMVLSQDYVVEKLTVLDNEYVYKQLEGGFTQPNAKVCKHMLTWACNQASLATKESDKTDLLELYCGNANFTLPLSQYFNKTLATEISKTSVAAALWNINANNIETNKQHQGVSEIAIARLSAEEFTEAKNGTREFRRLKQADIELTEYDFSTVFVDPPRAGIDDDTLALLSEFDNIIYISCNPETLAENLQTLCKTHKMVSTALFDQFPYTHHIEAGVLLVKQS